MNTLKKVVTMGVVVATIVWTMGLAAFVPMASAAVSLQPGTLIKGSATAVYYYAADGMRYTFPNEKTYYSWYPDFSNIVTISDAEMGMIDIKGNVVMRPGTYLIKISSVPKVFGVEPAIATKGQTRHLASESAAITLYGANWAQRIVDIPDGFYNNYLDINQALTGTEYPEGQLVKTTSAPDVFYVNGDASWSKIVSEAVFNANMFRWEFVVTAPAAMTHTAGADLTMCKYADVSQVGVCGTSVVPGGTVAVSFTNSPASAYVAKGAQNVNFGDFYLTVNGGSVTIDKIVLERTGLGYDTDFDAVRLFSGSQVGNDQSLNTTTHQVTFSGLNWNLTSSTNLTVKANTSSLATGTFAAFKIVSMTLSKGTATGMPVMGNAMYFATVTAGGLTVTGVTGSILDVLSGSVDQELGCWNFMAGASEDVKLNSLVLTNVGSASSSDATNFVLKSGSTPLPPTVASMSSNGEVAFGLTTPFLIKAGQTKKLCVYGDIKTGITVTRSIVFQVADSTDVAAIGVNTNGQVQLTGFTTQSGHTYNITQGSATLGNDAAYAPASADVVKGLPHVKMGAYKLSAGSAEGVKLTKLRLNLNDMGDTPVLPLLMVEPDVTNVDFTNWQLYQIVAGAEQLIPVSGSVSGSTIVFEDTNVGLADVPKSENRTFVVYADVSSSGAGDQAALGFTGPYSPLTTNTEARIKGLSSGDYILNGVKLNADLAAASQPMFDIVPEGKLAVTKHSSSPATADVAKGSTNVKLATFDFYATGENVTVSTLMVTLRKDGDTANVTSSDLTNVYLKSDSGVTLGSTVSSPASGTASFSFSLAVPKDGHRQVSVYADVPSSSLAANVIAKIVGAGDMDSDGEYSFAPIVETGFAVVANQMNITSPMITTSMGSSPALTTYVKNASGVVLGTILLAAEKEDVKVTSIKVSADADIDAAGPDTGLLLNTVSAASVNFTNLRLVDKVTPATQYGSQMNMTDGAALADYAIFSGIGNLTVTKGQTKELLLLGDVAASDLFTYYFGVALPANVTGVGVPSGADAVSALNLTPTVSKGTMTVNSGDLIVAKGSTLPDGAQLVSGSTNNDVMTYKLTAKYESVEVTELTLYFNGINNGIANLKLYKDGSPIGQAGGYALTPTAGGQGKALVTLPAGSLLIAKDANVNLTIKASLDADKNNVKSTPVSLVNFGIANAAGTAANWDGVLADKYLMKAMGQSSNTALESTLALNDALADLVGAPSGKIWGSNGFELHDGVLVVTVNPGSPVGVKAPGNSQEVLRLDLSAYGDDIKVTDMEFVKSGTCTPTGPAVSKLTSDSAGTNALKTFSYNILTVTGGESIMNDAPAGFDAGKSLTITAGGKQTVYLWADTNGCATSQSLQVALKAGGSLTASGIVWQDGELVDIDSTLTKTLPAQAGSALTY